MGPRLMGKGDTSNRTRLSRAINKGRKDMATEALRRSMGTSTKVLPPGLRPKDSMLTVILSIPDQVTVAVIEIRMVHPRRRRRVTNRSEMVRRRAINSNIRTVQANGKLS